MLSSIVLFALAFVGAENMDMRYEDLVHSSMQSVVALNEVVSNIGEQISQLSASLLDARITLQKTEDLVRSLAKRIDDEEMERKESVKSLKQEIEEVANLTSSLEVAVKVGEITTSKRIDDEEAERIKSVQSLKQEIEEVANLTSLLEMAKKEREIMIVSGEQSAGDETCIKVCAGTTGRSTTDWSYYSSNAIYEDVDISYCGFTTVPTVTTSIEGSSHHWLVTGSSSIYSVTTTSFRIYLNNGGIQLADDKQWNVEWIAVGYTC